MYTERDALMESKELWLEMVVMGYAHKPKYLERKHEGYLNDCPLCEFYMKGRVDARWECCGCPFQEFGAVKGCLEKRSPYKVWLVNRYREVNRGYLARKVYSFLARAYRERYRKPMR